MCMTLEDVKHALEHAQANPPYECDEDSYAMAIQLALDLLDNLQGPAAITHSECVDQTL